MQNFATRGLFFIIIIFIVAQRAVFSDINRFEWQKASPASQGMSFSILEKMKNKLAAKRTKTLLIIRNDKIVYEWYATGFDSTKRHYTASLAKALVGGTSLLLAFDDGLIFPDAPACYYIPQWKKDAKRAQITIRQLATHSSGLEDANQILDGVKIPHNKLLGWKGAFWRKDPDPFTVARDQTPLISQPGREYHYSNPGMTMLAYAVTASLKNSDYCNIRDLLKNRIIRPIGIKDKEWSIGYGKTFKIDGLDLVANWGGGSFTARAVARIGRLMLRKGNWQGRQLIDSTWVKRALEYTGTPLPDRPHGNPQPASGLAWYTNFDGVWPRVPCDAFAGAGAGNQVLLVIPSLKMIVVRNGGNLFDGSKGEGFWGGLEKYLFNPIMESVNNPPYPKSRFITGAEFAPSSTIVRKAPGSDNWPLTWGNDDALYTAYGDGWGFEPRTDIKLSLGIAKITGSAENFRGSNIRTPSGERVGQGKRGAKAGGMLMVNGILYMLVRNTGNSQIAWSQDYGRTWQWCDWQFETSFGCPTFLNFGKNYRGARDDFVYIYSHDASSAYKPSDRMVLARVAKDRIRERDAYEFFTGFNADGQPEWSVDIRRRGAVFQHPARCYRSGISYNPFLKRYLWCQIIPGNDTRHDGGFGIYEAPEPWGPWSTVFFTRKWDVGPGESCSLPTKWISEDGKTCYLVFSGNDTFSARRLVLKTE